MEAVQVKRHWVRRAYGNTRSRPGANAKTFHICFFPVEKACAGVWFRLPSNTSYLNWCGANFQSMKAGSSDWISELLHPSSGASHRAPFLNRRRVMVMQNVWCTRQHDSLSGVSNGSVWVWEGKRIKTAAPALWIWNRAQVPHLENFSYAINWWQLGSI